MTVEDFHVASQTQLSLAASLFSPSPQLQFFFKEKTLNLFNIAGSHAPGFKGSRSTSF